MFVKNLYLHAPFVGIFLERDLTPVEAWSSLHGAIVDAMATFDCCPIIYWLQVAFTRKSGVNQQSLLAMYRPTDPLAEGNLM